MRIGKRKGTAVEKEGRKEGPSSSAHHNNNNNVRQCRNNMDPVKKK